MTAKLEGKAQRYLDQVLDAPSRVLVSSAADWLELATTAGSMLICPDRPITRRLTAHVTIDPIERTIRAHRTVAEAIDFARVSGLDSVLFCTRVGDIWCTAYRLDLRSAIQCEVSHG